MIVKKSFYLLAIKTCYISCEYSLEVHCKLLVLVNLNVTHSGASNEY